MSRVPRFAMLVVGLVAGVALVLGGIFVVTNPNINVFAQAPDAVAEPDAPLAISQVLSYQGRLLTPSTGDPKPDTIYQMTFSIYNVASGGAALWTETKSVTVVDGAFSTLLGDTTPLVLNNYNGQELFLGIKVGDDPEATPRQRLAHTAYAMWAEKAGSANTATTATNATNATNAANATTAGNAGTLDNLDSTAFAAASHNHSGAAINAGTVAEARIDGALARDNEVKGIMLANDGAGSALDADLLDGQSSTAFAVAAHTHTGAQITDGSIASADITDESIASADIQNITRTIGFPAFALIYLDDGFGVMTEWDTGLNWEGGVFTEAAYLNIPRPTDWDGTSNVNFELYFMASTSTPGNVQFVINPRSYDPGEIFGTVADVTGPVVPVSALNQIGRQTISISAAALTKSMWVIEIHRAGPNETYTDSIYLMSVGLTYTATR